uniref:Transposase n=1 Tax=Steinernema glaseri TaxID=37863 RepID=A0A1I7ZJE9_9BILA
MTLDLTEAQTVKEVAAVLSRVGQRLLTGFVDRPFSHRPNRSFPRCCPAIFSSVRRSPDNNRPLPMPLFKFLTDLLTPRYSHPMSPSTTFQLNL